MESTRKASINNGFFYRHPYFWCLFLLLHLAGIIFALLPGGLIPGRVEEDLLVLSFIVFEPGLIIASVLVWEARLDPISFSIIGLSIVIGVNFCAWSALISIFDGATKLITCKTK